MCRKLVAYYRVSTQKQGKSGLGLEAQEADVQRYLASLGSDAKLLSAYTEIESGKRNNRPQLHKAMEHARLTGATLVIAKLDRLSRDAHFLLGLQKANVDFVACDMPSADRFTVGIMAMLAQKERELISERTKAALAMKKESLRKAREALETSGDAPVRKLADGRAVPMRLGCPKGAQHLRVYGNTAAVDAVRSQATDRATGLQATIDALRQEGITSANAMAKALNERHISTPRGGQWTARSVINIIQRLAP